MMAQPYHWVCRGMAWLLKFPYTLMHYYHPLLLQICYYRDKISINKFQVSRVTKAGVTVSEPFSLDMRWDYKLFAKPTQWAVGAW